MKAVGTCNFGPVRLAGLDEVRTPIEYCCSWLGKILCDFLCAVDDITALVGVVLISYRNPLKSAHQTWFGPVA